MELHQLRYFVAVAREGTFTRAAEGLHITQPSLSEQVRKLETELGSPLFQRLGRSLALTSAGEALLPHAERVVLEVEQARVRVEEVRGVRRGKLTIGALPGPAARLLPRLLAEFRQRHPGVEVVLDDERTSGELEQLVHDGGADLGIVLLPPVRRPELDAMLLGREEIVAVVPRGHRFGDRRAIRLAELADEPFVALRPGFGLRDVMDRQCRRAGFTPRVVFEAGRLATVIGLVQSGVGVTIAPGLTAGPEVRRLVLRDPDAFREIGVVWRRGQPLSSAAAIFLEMLRRAAPASAAVVAPDG